MALSLLEEKARMLALSRARITGQYEDLVASQALFLFEEKARMLALSRARITGQYGDLTASQALCLIKDKAKMLALWRARITGVCSMKSSPAGDEIQDMDTSEPEDLKILTSGGSDTNPPLHGNTPTPRRHIDRKATSLRRRLVFEE